MFVSFLSCSLLPVCKLAPHLIYSILLSYILLLYISSQIALHGSLGTKMSHVACRMSQMNPSATASLGLGFGEQKGTIQYVSLSDIQSGKVQLPQYGGKTNDKEKKDEKS